jgi:hypothetical protein
VGNSWGSRRAQRSGCLCRLHRDIRGDKVGPRNVRPQSQQHWPTVDDRNCAAHHLRAPEPARPCAAGEEPRTTNFEVVVGRQRARLLTAAPKALCVAARCWQRRPRFNPTLLAPAILETVEFLAQAHQSDVRVKGPHFQGSLPIRPAQISTRGAPCCLRRQEMRWGSPAELMLDPASGRFPVPFPPLSPLYLTRAVPLLIPASFAAFTHSRPNCHLRPVTHSHLTISLSHDATTPTAQQQQHPLRTQTCVTLPPWC